MLAQIVPVQQLLLHGRNGRVHDFGVKRHEIEQMLTMVDGILLRGGQDVSPALYGEASRRIFAAFAGSMMRD